MTTLPLPNSMSSHSGHTGHCTDRAHQHAAPASQRADEKLALAAAAGVIFTAVIAWAIVLFLGVKLSVWQTPRPLPAYHLRLAALPAGPMLDAPAASHGRDLFESSCNVCHGNDGLGRTGLGKSLVHSDFVADRSDADMLAFIVRGRDVTDPLNTTRVAMPPRGGNATFTDADIASIVTYVRALQDPRRMPALLPPQPIVTVITEADKAAALAAAGGDAELAEYIASGTRLFAKTCAACHGANAKGLPNLGKDLTVSKFVADNNDDALLAFIKKGRNPGEAGNTTGVAMPPKGGNPALSEDDLLDIISFLRSIHSAAPAPAPSP